jgi:ABC-type transport system involved in multi-copper enzyme maturation permease subunit
MRLLGPVFWFDLVRVARRQPLALWRSVYGLGLLGALFVLYVNALPEAMLGGYVSKNDAAAFATRFADVFMAVQFAAVILVTPALTANAVAEEKSKYTLPFLLGTQLSSREILLGKLFTRLLQVGLLILTGLPVLALVQFMGGVDLMQIVAEYAALALTALSLGCLGLFCGVFVKKPANAAWRAYQVLIAYLALSMLSIWYFDLPAGRWGIWYFSGYMADAPLALSPEPPFHFVCLNCFNAPNPYFAWDRLAFLQKPGLDWTQVKLASPAVNTFSQNLTLVLSDYAIAHGSLSFLLAGLAIARLRPVAAKQNTGVTHKKKLILRPAPHPPIGERPVLWKELYCEAKPRQRWLRVFFGRWFYFASFVPAYVFIVLTIDQGVSTLSRNTLFLVRFAGTAVVSLLCLRVALHAARSIGGERDRQTLDSLLTTQLTPGEIVHDKWWGSLLVGRWVFVWLLVHWCLAMLTFALHPLALMALVIETFVYAAFAASLGMYFAAVCSTTRKALACTLMIGLLGTTLSPLGIGKMAAILAGEPPPPPNWFSNMKWQPKPMSMPERLCLGLVPAWVMSRTVVPLTSYYPATYNYKPAWYEYDSGRSVAEVELPAMMGLLVYAVAAGVVVSVAVERFGNATKSFRHAAKR